jgi:hypothetical protein
MRQLRRQDHIDPTGMAYEPAPRCAGLLATIGGMNALPLPVPTMRRLAIVKYLRTQGLEQEQKGGPLAGLALLPLHDAVELFLQVAAETHHLTLRKSVDFIEYWTEFSNAARPLRYQQQMRRFNNARVEVKHRGTLPSQPDVEGFRATVTNFLVETTPELFQTDFNSISLSSLVRADDVRSALQAAETAAQADQFKESLEQAAKAFHLCLRNHRWLETPRLFDPTDAARELRQSARHDRMFSDFSSFTRSFEEVAEMGESLGEAITILAYHLDYDGYRYLRTFGPGIYPTAGLAGVSVQWMQEPTTDRSIVDRCLAFAVDAALRLEGR